jgi:hypothetical protein
MDIKSILGKHGKWLRNVKGGERANLSGCNLSKRNLRGSNLGLSDLSESDLSLSDLSGSDLRGSDLSGSNLSLSNLSGSNLSLSNLSGSDLSGSNLSGCNLSEANLPTGVRIISVSGVGSARRLTNYRADTDEVWCGCFTGTLQEFAAKIEVTHKSNKTHLSDYRAVVAMLEAFRANNKPAKRGRGER